MFVHVGLTSPKGLPQRCRQKERKKNKNKKQKQNKTRRKKKKRKKKLIQKEKLKRRTKGAKYLPVRDKRRIFVDVVAVVADGNGYLRIV